MFSLREYDTERGVLPLGRDSLADMWHTVMGELLSDMKKKGTFLQDVGVPIPWQSILQGYISHYARQIHALRHYINKEPAKGFDWMRLGKYHFDSITRGFYLCTVYIPPRCEESSGIHHPAEPFKLFMRCTPQQIEVGSYGEIIDAETYRPLQAKFIDEAPNDESHVYYQIGVHGGLQRRPVESERFWSCRHRDFTNVAVIPLSSAILLSEGEAYPLDMRKLDIIAKRCRHWEGPFPHICPVCPHTYEDSAFSTEPLSLKWPTYLRKSERKESRWR